MSTPDDLEREATEDAGPEWEEDDYDDAVSDSIPEDEDADIDYLDYVDRYCSEDA